MNLIPARPLGGLVLAAAVALLAAGCLAQDNGDPIDWNRAQQLHQRVQRGEKLSPEDQAYYDRARKVYEQQHGGGQAATPANPGGGPTGVSDGIDWDRARTLHQRAGRGEQLTADEQAYLNHAREVFGAKGGRVGTGAAGGPPAGGAAPAGGQPATPSPAAANLAPLTELTTPYEGQDGGLYGHGQNAPPPALLQAALGEAAQTRPLDAQGQPSPDGRIGLISVGMSNTTMEFRTFMELANADPQKSPVVTLVDGADGGMSADRWAQAAQAPPAERNPWETLAQRLRTAGLSPQQVQVAWIKQALPGPQQYGPFPGHVTALQRYLATIVTTLRQRYPNLRLAYLSSRIYAGYAQSNLNPEPYAYEGAFAVRGLITQQLNGEASLNADPARGAVCSPVLLWGPYLWAAGTQGRKLDTLTWSRKDLAADGTHPSASGARKVAEQLLSFLKTDPTARPWFTRG